MRLFRYLTPRLDATVQRARETSRVATQDARQQALDRRFTPIRPALRLTDVSRPVSVPGRAEQRFSATPTPRPIPMGPQIASSAPAGPRPIPAQIPAQEAARILEGYSARGEQVPYEEFNRLNAIIEGGRSVVPRGEPSFIRAPLGVNLGLAETASIVGTGGVGSGGVLRNVGATIGGEVGARLGLKGAEEAGVPMQAAIGPRIPGLGTPRLGTAIGLGTGLVGGVGGFAAAPRVPQAIRAGASAIAEAPGVTQRGGVRGFGRALVTEEAGGTRFESNRAKTRTSNITTPEREALRTQIADEVYGQGAVNKEKILDIYIGPPASGKSTLAREMTPHRGAIEVDTDAARERIPEYRDASPEARREVTHLVHDEAADIAEGMIMERALRAGDNIVYPAIGRSFAKLESRIQSAQKLGYRVNLHLVEVSPDIAKQRALARFDRSGRPVSETYIDEVAKAPRQTYNRIRGIVDGFEEIDNSGATPVRINSSGLDADTPLQGLQSRGEVGGPGRPEVGQARADAGQVDPGARAGPAPEELELSNDVPKGTPPRLIESGESVRQDDSGLLGRRGAIPRPGSDARGPDDIYAGAAAGPTAPPQSTAPEVAPTPPPSNPSASLLAQEPPSAVAPEPSRAELRRAATATIATPERQIPERAKELLDDTLNEPTETMISTWRAAFEGASGPPRRPKAPPETPGGPIFEGLGFDPRAERNLRVALGQAKGLREPGPLDGILKGVNRIINVARARNPRVQAAAEARANFAEAEALRREAQVVQTVRTANELFGKEAVQGKQVRAWIGRFNGKAVDQTGIVGTLAHIIDRPEMYRLTEAQRQFVFETHDAMLRRDLDRLRRLGGDAPELVETYISYAVKKGDPSKVGEAIAGGSTVSKAKASFQKGRDSIDLVDFAGRVRRQGFEPELDYEQLLRKRLYAGGRVQADQIFVNETKRLAKRGIGSEAVGHPKFGDLRFDPQDARDIKSILDSGQVTDETGKVLTTGVEALREVLLNFDLSGAFGIQGLRFFLSEGPIKALANAPRVIQFMASRDGFNSWLLTNTDDLQEATLSGLRIFSQPIEVGPGALSTSKLAIEKVPGIGRVIGPPTRKLNEIQFGRLVSFYKFTTWQHHLDVLRGARDSRFSEALRTLPGVRKMMKITGGLDKSTTDEALKAAASEHVNNVYGGLRVEKVGSSPVQRALLLTPQWLRANIGILTTPLKGDPQGILARRWLAQSVALVGGISVGVSLATTGQMPNLHDPRKTDWLSIKLPGGQVPLFPARTYIRTVARMLGGTPGFGETDKSVGGRVEELGRFGFGRAAQPVNLAVDLATGEDYMGRKIGNPAQYVGESLLPIVAQGAIETVREKKSPLETVSRIATESTGTSYIPETPAARRNEIAQEMFGKDYFELDTDERQQIDGREDVQKLSEETNERQRKRADKFQQAEDQFNEDAAPYREDQAADDAAAETGRMDISLWKKNTATRQAQLSAARQSTYNTLGIEFDDRKDLPPIRAALENYWAVDADNFKDPATREIDFDDFDTARDATLAGLTEAQRDAAYRQTEKNLTPFQRRYKAAQRTLDEAPVKYRGASAAQIKEIDDFGDEVVTKTKELEKETGYDLTQRTVARALSEQPDRSPDLYDWWSDLQSASKRQDLVDPAYDSFLKSREAVLRTFYPYLYGPSFYERQGEGLQDVVPSRSRPQRPTRPSRAEMQKQAAEQRIVEEALAR